jgi:SAM-dependent methyltransferase
MNADERHAHWTDLYAKKREDEVSWFQTTPSVSLDLIARTGLPTTARLIDVGAGASRLVDALLDRGFSALTLLDVAEPALAASRARLGPRAGEVRWIARDLLDFVPDAPFDLWHDRAVFHFLTESAQRAAYADLLRRSLRPAGQAIVGTFSPDGPEKCSGLPVVRYDAAGLVDALGPGFKLLETLRHEHVTPSGRVQPFTFVRMERQ